VGGSAVGKWADPSSGFPLTPAAPEMPSTFYGQPAKPARSFIIVRGVGGGGPPLFDASRAKKLGPEQTGDGKADSHGDDEDRPARGSRLRIS